MPPMVSSSSVVLTTAGSVGERVAGLLHRRADLCLVERPTAGHGDGAGGQVDGHVRDALDRADLLRHGPHAVHAGHAGDGVGVPVHDSPFLQFEGSPCSTTAHHDLTSRAIAALASASLTSATPPPCAAAWATQCRRCSSSSPSATASRALVAAETCVNTSMQYWSPSIIFAIPRTWPSIRRIRLR